MSTEFIHLDGSADIVTSGAWASSHHPGTFSFTPCWVLSPLKPNPVTWENLLSLHLVQATNRCACLWLGHQPPCSRRGSHPTCSQSAHLFQSSFASSLNLPPRSHLALHHGVRPSPGGAQLLAMACEPRSSGHARWRASHRPGCSNPLCMWPVPPSGPLAVWRTHHVAQGACLPILYHDYYYPFS